MREGSEGGRNRKEERRGEENREEGVRTVVERQTDEQINRAECVAG